LVSYIAFIGALAGVLDFIYSVASSQPLGTTVLLAGLTVFLSLAGFFLRML
jgi:hypothetical protein